MRRIVLTLAIVVMIICPWLTTAGAESVCTITLAPPGPVPSTLAGTVCLHGGIYHQTQLQLSASAPATLMSVPGERAVLQATGAGGLWVRSPYITFDHLTVDNGGFDNAALTLNTSAAHFVLLDSEVRHGAYYGLDIWAPNVTLSRLYVHDFEPADQVVGNDAQCLNVHGTADRGLLTGSQIAGCWGDGIQFYAPLPNLDTTILTSGWVISGNTFLRGGLRYSENAIDVKGTHGMTIIANELAGYQNPLLGTGQPALVAHGNAENVTIAGNTIRDSYEGIQLSNGTWQTFTITGNIIRNITHYSLDVAGARGLVFGNNTIDRGGSEVIQVVANGWIGGSLDHNLIIASGAPRLYSGASWSGVAIGPNAWVTATAGFLASPLDARSALTGYGAALPAASTPTATPTATASPTTTETPTVFVTPTPTSSPTLTSSPTTTASPTATQTPTPACLAISSGQVCFFPYTPTP